MLELKQASWANGRGFSVREVSLSLRKGRLTALMGPNGAGKSTILRLMTGEIVPDSGQALLDGVPVHQISRRQFARKAAVIRQERSFTFPMTCMELVLTGRTPFLGFMGRTGEREREMARSALLRTGAEHLMNFSAMDARQAVRAMQLVKALARERGMAVLCILHDLHIAHAFADEIVLLEDGRIAAQGSPHQISGSEAMRRLTGMKITVCEGGLMTEIEEQENRQ